MTVSTIDNVIEYVDGGPDFPIPYRFLRDEDIQVELTTPNGLTETLSAAQYSLVGAGSAGGGTMTSAYASGILALGGAILTVSRIMAPLQPIDLRNQGRYLAETQETGLDRLTMLIQQGINIASRALRRPVGKNYYDAQGRQIKNLGAPTLEQDATTKKYVDYADSEISSRVDALSAGLPGTNYAFPWSTITTQSTNVLTPGFTFFSATLAINGATQTFGRAYVVVNNTIVLAEAIPAGTEVSAILGQQVLPTPDSLDVHLVADYAELRGYAGPSSFVFVTGPGISGPFTKIAPGATDDGGITVGLYKRLFTGPVFPEWFGAVGNGSSECSDAIQAALDSGFPVRFSKGVYCCNKGLVSRNKAVTIEGSGSQLSEIRFTAQVTYGIRVEQNSAYETNISDLFVSTNLLNTGKGISVSYVGFVGEFDRNKRFANVIGNRVAGANYFAHGWKTCFEFDEVTLPLIEKNFAVGYRNLAGSGEAQWWPWTEFGFVYTSSTNLSPTDVLFNENDCRYARTAYQNLGVLEGVRYNDCLAVACKFGIIDDRREVSGPVTIDPWLLVTGGHYNVSAIGIQTYYLYQGWIKDSLIYQFTFVDEAFVGVSTQTGNNLKISGNHITGNKDSAFTVKGIKVQQNNNSVVSFNEIEGVDIPIECSGTDGIVGTRFFMNRGLNKAGAEAITVTYTNGASQYSNPSSIPSGVISEGSNLAVVAIASGGFSTIASFSLDQYPAGSSFRISSICQVTKGTTAGTTKLYVEKTAGTANVLYMANATGMGVQNDSHVASTNWQANLVGIIKKVSDGSLTLKLAVSSGGSNASVAIADGQYVLERTA